MEKLEYRKLIERRKAMLKAAVILLLLSLPTVYLHFAASKIFLSAIIVGILLMTKQIQKLNYKISSASLK